MAIICDTFATESFGNLVDLAESIVLPGAPPQVILLVRDTHTTVAMRLLFKALP